MSANANLHRSYLGEIDIGRALNRGKRGKLKNEISKPEQNKCEPDPFIAKQTTKPVAQRDADRIKEQHDDVAA